MRHLLVTFLALPAVAAGVNLFRYAGSHESVTPSQKKAVALTQREDVEGGRRLAGLLDVARDLESDKKKDDTSLRQLETQIVGLVKQRDAMKRDEVRKARELSFLHTEIGRARGSIGSDQAQAVTQAAEAGAAEESKVDTNVESAIASADQVVKEAAGSTESAAAATAAKTDEKAQAEESAAQAEAEASRAEATAQSAQAAEAAAEKQKVEAAKAEAAKAMAEAQAEKAAAQKMKEQAKAEAEAEARAEARLRAEAEAKAKAKIEAEEKIKREAEEKVRREQEEKEAKVRAQQEAERKKKEQLADSADDSFKQFMKEEDGEDQMGDADYEDSANALAGAIGWNRNDIEKKADNAVKQLTEAIGGKKVVQSLQGMMSGIGASQR